MGRERNDCAKWMVPAMLVAGLVVLPARGDLVTWEFEGVLTFVNDYTGFLGPSVYVGAPFSGQLAFDTSVPDNDPGDPHTGSYPQALVTISGNVGEVSFAGGSGPTSRILVVNDDLTTLHDVMSMGGRVSINGQTVEAYLNFRDLDAAMLTSDALPLDPPDVGLMETRVFGLASEALGLSVRGTLSSLTPEPGTLAVLGLGVAQLAIGRRTRPRQRTRVRHPSRRTLALLAWLAVFCLFPAYQPARASCDPASYDCAGVPACRCTDLVILWDLTPSLDLAYDNIQGELPSVLEMAWCRAGGSSGDLRVGLIVFFNQAGVEGRDAVKVQYPLTSDVQDVCLNGIGNPTSGIYWFGIGYGPEASDEALHEMLGATAWAGAASCVHTPAVRFTEPFRQECRKIAILITDAVPGTCHENAHTCEARLRGYRWADQAAAAGIELAAVFVFNDYARREREDDAQEILREYVRRTDGLYVQLPADGDGLADALEPILARCPDCNGNEVDDWADIVAATSTDCNLNGIPDECEPDCDGNGVADPCQVPAFGGADADCDFNGVPDHCQNDCDNDGVIDPCQVMPIGTDPDCDCNTVPDQCDPDCDNSGVVDACDDCRNFCWDFDRDCDVDLPDFGSFQICVSSNGMASRADCYCAFDITSNGDVEWDDYPAFEDALAGPPAMGGLLLSPPGGQGMGQESAALAGPESEPEEPEQAEPPATNATIELRPVGGGAAVTTLTANTTYEVHYATDDLTAVNYVALFGVTDSAEKGHSAAAQAASGDWADAPWFQFWYTDIEGVELVQHGWMAPGFGRYQVVESEFLTALTEDAEEAAPLATGPSGLLCTITTGKAGEFYLEVFLSLLDPAADSCEDAYGLARFEVAP